MCANDALAAIYGLPESDSILIHHGSLPYEMISEYQKSNLVSSIKEPHSKYYAHKSVVGLKCGKVLIAGVEGKQSDTILTDIDVNIYDPKTNTYGTGLTFGAYGKLVSCYEQKQNQVYCAYVSIISYKCKKVNTFTEVRGFHINRKAPCGAFLQLS